MQQQTKTHSVQRAPGSEHIPLFPRGYIALRIVQLILSVIILGLAAYGASDSTGLTGDYLTLFAAASTLIVTVYYLVCEFGPKVAYNYWAVLALDIFLIVFWIAGFALLAAQIAPYGNGVYECDYDGYCATYNLGGAALIAFACLATAAGLGGVEFVLFVVSLAIHAVMMHRHRSAGLHCTPSSSPVAPVLADAGLAEKQHAHANTAPVYAPQPAPAYLPQQHQHQLQHQQVQATPFAQAPAAAYPQHTPSPHNNPHAFAAPPPVAQLPAQGQAPPAQYYQPAGAAQPGAYHHPQ